MRRLAGVSVGAAMLFGLLVPAGVAAPLPDGPRLAFGLTKFVGGGGAGWDRSVRTVFGSSTLGYGSVLIGGGRIQPLAGGAWAPDGSAFAFTGAPRNSVKGRGSGIYAVSAEGGGAALIPGANKGWNPVFSPDGRTLAFSRIEPVKAGGKKPTAGDILNSNFTLRTTTWTLDLASGRSRRLTGPSGALQVTPTSFSPDGRILLADRGDSVVKIAIGSGWISRFANNARAAKYSPDGTRVALVSYRDGLVVKDEEGDVRVGELYVVRLDTGKWRRLTRSRSREEYAPSWDPSGERLAFTQAPGPMMSMLSVFEFGEKLMQVNADGTCLTRLIRPRDPYSFSVVFGPAWRPGPGREAGRIAC